MSTPGAIRAAALITRNIDWDGPGFTQWMEKTIDRETHAPEMLEALEAVENECDGSAAMNMVRAAISKVRGKK